MQGLFFKNYSVDEIERHRRTVAYCKDNYASAGKNLLPVTNDSAFKLKKDVRSQITARHIVESMDSSEILQLVRII